jgi:hypothetical protein
MPALEVVEAGDERLWRNSFFSFQPSALSFHISFCGAGEAWSSGRTDAIDEES